MPTRDLLATAKFVVANLHWLPLLQVTGTCACIVQNSNNHAACHRFSSPTHGYYTTHRHM